MRVREKTKKLTVAVVGHPRKGRHYKTVVNAMNLEFVFVAGDDYTRAGDVQGADGILILKRWASHAATDRIMLIAAGRGIPVVESTHSGNDFVAQVIREEVLPAIAHKAPIRLAC